MRRSCCALFLLAAGCGVTTPPAPPSVPPPPIVAEKGAPSPAPKAVPPPSTPAKAAPAKPTAAKPPPPSTATSSKPALDLKGLEQRLRNTEAIGVLTKLSLKNQVDDLIARFRQFHDGRRPPTLAELRPAFELLLMKVLSLLQDSDKALARDINASRDALWSVLSDRDKLAQYQ
jgi:hypothetical protein